MSVSTKELFTAFFKGLAFAKGLNFGDKNRGMAEDRWITIHPWGMSQGEADTGEGKGYYKRIFIDDETGEIEKGLGAGTNIKDLSKTLKAKKNSQENESTSKKTVKEPTTLRDKIKALTEGKEYTEEVANKVGDLLRQELLKNKEFKAIIDNATDRNDEAICKEWGKLYKESLNVDKDYQGTLDEIQRVKEEIFQKYGKTWTAYAYIENDKRIKSLERKSKKISSKGNKKRSEKGRTEGRGTGGQRIFGNTESRGEIIGLLPVKDEEEIIFRLTDLPSLQRYCYDNIHLVNTMTKKSSFCHL